MRYAVVSVGFAAVLAGNALLACGSDDDQAGSSTDSDASPGNGSSGPGRVGGGSTGIPPLPPFDGGATTPCFPCQLETTLLSALPITPSPCCIDIVTCGVAGTALGDELEGIVPGVRFPSPGCVSEDEMRRVLDDMTDPEIRSDENGLVLDEDGGVLVGLDESCPAVSVSNPLYPIELPGCCRPDDTCGVSTHTIWDVNAATALVGEAEIECIDGPTLQAMVDASGNTALRDSLGIVGRVGGTCVFGSPSSGGSDGGASPSDARTPAPDTSSPTPDAGIPTPDASVSDGGAG